jgi:putative DNA methylase
MDHPIISPKKLIEVALPLDAINAACAREKSIRHGHPSTLHLWWARRPLTAARATIFGQLVNDPSWRWEMENPGQIPPGHIKASWAASRKRLFAIIEELVQWENTANDSVLEKARVEIRKSWRETCAANQGHPNAPTLFDPERLPGFHDPFAGGGAIPLEAQRLGLESFASDLNPVPVLLNKAMIEIPPKFVGQPPVSKRRHSENANTKRKAQELPMEQVWRGALGLAEDIRHYGEWMREEAHKRIGRLYPTVEITKETASDRPDLKSLVGDNLTVIAWIWARTVKSPNPAFSHVDVPLASTFILSSKAGKEVYVQPIVCGDSYQFTIKVGKPPLEAKSGTKLARGANFRCILSQTSIEPHYIKSEGMQKRLGARLMAVVCEGKKGRVYLPPQPDMERIAQDAQPSWIPETPLPDDVRNFWTLNYGLSTFSDLFTPRQLVALTTFADLVREARELVYLDATSAGLANGSSSLEMGGSGAESYADSVALFLGLLVDKMAFLGSSICYWEPIAQCPRGIFARQSIPMTWDYAEPNPFSTSSGCWDGFVKSLSGGAEALLGAASSTPLGHATQADARSQVASADKVVSTDPPYYDNIGYANLSDYFYVWLRRSLRSVFPTLFASMVVPKADELVADPYRHGGREEAELFFLNGMTQALQRVTSLAHPAFPVSIYYAFKQSESTKNGTHSTGWETFLEAIIGAGLMVTGTWPMRTEMTAALKDTTNVLASSIVLVCRRRPLDATTISRREFIRELNQVLPYALDEMTRGSVAGQSPVAPVDLSQAIIGPGMAVFSKYAAVLEADGSPMSGRTALQLINRFLAEDDFDADTQFCLHWFEQCGWETGKFGEADVLARSKGTSVDGVKNAGVLHSAGGNVRLLKWGEYPNEWDPKSDQRLPIWEVLHQLIRVFNTDGETGAAAVFASVQSKAEAARQLAYRLYTLCERKNWAEDARAYNEVVTSWSGIESAAAKEPSTTQRMLFDN